MAYMEEGGGGREKEENGGQYTSACCLSLVTARSGTIRQGYHSSCLGKFSGKST